MKKDISLEKVAQQAGVAKSTVSFVLNNKGNVAPQTRKKVLAALQELGYMRVVPPPAAARPETAGEKKNILVYVNPTVKEDEVFSTYMAGLREYTARQDRLAFSFAMSSTEVESRLQLQFLEQAARPRAIVMIGINSDHSFIAQALATGKPSLIINRINPHPDLSYVSINHEEAGREAARYLLALGHRHFAIVLEDYYNETELIRLESLLAELAAEQPAGRVALVRSCKAAPEMESFAAGSLAELLLAGKITLNSETPLKLPDGLAVIRHPEQLNSEFEPTCVVAANDYTAGQTQAGLQAAGLVIPLDVSVMSLNNSSISLSTSPQITVIDELRSDQGYLAGRILSDLLEEPKMRSQKIQIRHRLIERGSTARPRNFIKL